MARTIRNTPISRCLAPFLAALAVALMVLAPGAKADPDLDQALVLYRDGAFREASEAASPIGTAEGLALAARASLAYAAYGAAQEEKLAALDRGEGFARSALEIDPDNIGALLHLSIALGYRARIEGYLKAHFAGRAKEAKKLLDHALAVAPGDAMANAALGAWNAEVVVGGGRLLAATIYRASAKKAIGHFRRALEIEPGNPVIRIEFAKALLDMKPSRNKSLALEQLDTALAVEPGDAFGGIIFGHGRQLRAAIGKDGGRAIKALLKSLEPFGPRASRAATGRPR